MIEAASCEKPVDAEIETEEFRLWRAIASGEEHARARRGIFNRYLPLASQIAARHMAARGRGDIEFGDLHQLACTGLLEAIDRFDAELGIPFAAFARKRINGRVIDGLAAMSEVSAQISYRSRLKRERIRSLGATAPQLRESGDEAEAIIDIAIGLAIGFMLEDMGLYHEKNMPDRQPNAYESLAWKDMVDRVAREVDAIGGREREIIRYHYHEGLDFTKIAGLMNLTKGRISQLHRKSIDLLRKKLGHAGSFRLTG